MSNKFTSYQLVPEDKKYDTTAKIVAGIFALLIIALLFLIGYYPPEKTPQQEGIIVNLGNKHTGRGSVEPQANKVSKPIQKISPQKQANPDKTPPPDKQETLLTSQNPESITIEKKTPSKKIKKAVEPNPIKKTPPEDIVKSQKKEIKKSIEEPPKPVVDENALFPGKASNNSTNSQGISKGKGNQGVKDGTSDAENYIGKNKGLGNLGIGHDLSGRSIISTPDIKDDSPVVGTVKIKIRVNQEGKVISATYVPLGSTTNDPRLIKKASEAAYKVKFNAHADKTLQIGTLTFNFQIK